MQHTVVDKNVSRIWTDQTEMIKNRIKKKKQFLRVDCEIKTNSQKPENI